MTLHITNKVRERIKVPAFDQNPTPNPEFLEAWYVNLFTLARKKWFIFSEAKTLYSVVVDASGFTSRKLFEGLATDVLFDQFKRNSHLPIRIFESVADQVFLCKTENRRILGSQNDLIFMAHGVVEYHGDFSFERINKTPLSYLDDNPITAFEDEVAKTVGRTLGLAGPLARPLS